MKEYAELQLFWCLVIKVEMMKPCFVAIFIVLNATWNYKKCCHIPTYKGLIGVMRDVSTTGIDSGIELCLIYTYIYIYIYI